MCFKTPAYLLLLLSLCITKSLVSQQKLAIIDPKIAKESLEKGYYSNALRHYLHLIEKEPKNEDYNYNIGLCYLNANINKAKAIPYFEAVLKINSENYNALYYLGLAYHQAYRFDDAIEMFERFKNTGKGDKKNQNEVGHQIQYCINAKELVKFPVNVTFENLGKNVNSTFPDYMPFIPEDESYIVYNSKRNGAGSVKDVEDDGAYSAGIYISKIVGEDFSKTKNIGPPINNGSGDQEIVGMSSSGEIILIWRFDYELGYAALFQSNSDKKKNFRKAEVLSKEINSQDQEIFASITDDGSTLYFSSIRNGGLGGSDLYVCKKLPDGTWGKAQNLGDEINTDGDEDFPNISSDGKTLYFSSNKHLSMGGFDIFRAVWDESTDTWGNVKNVGYPINTPADDNNLRVSKSGRYGYTSALRQDGLGDLDIYKVIFKDIEPKYTVVRGNISSSDTLQKLNYSNLRITVINNETKEIYGKYRVNSFTGNYILILTPGLFTLTLETTEFLTINEIISVNDKSQAPTEVTKNFILEPK